MPEPLSRAGRDARNSLVAVVLLNALSCGPPLRPAPPGESSSVLLDLSGIAWIDGERFLAVHDSKNPDENDRPRVGILSIPIPPAIVSWQPVQLEWPPPLGLSSDLESIAHIPGTDSYLLVESGEGLVDGRQYRRVLHMRVSGSHATLVSFTELPAPVHNVEGTAVARVGDRLVLIFAERAEGEVATDLAWADLRLEPLELGTPQRIHFAPEGMGRPGWRPVTALEIDVAGRIFVASAYDPGDDGGPFTSVIWLAGHVEADGTGEVVVALDEAPQRIATLDGFKVESLGIRPGVNGDQLFAGTDDEDWGGTIRPIPLPWTPLPQP